MYVLTFNNSSTILFTELCITVVATSLLAVNLFKSNCLAKLQKFLITNKVKPSAYKHQNLSYSRTSIIRHPLGSSIYIPNNCLNEQTI